MVHVLSDGLGSEPSLPLQVLEELRHAGVKGPLQPPSRPDKSRNDESQHLLDGRPCLRQHGPSILGAPTPCPSVPKTLLHERPEMRRQLLPGLYASALRERIEVLERRDTAEDVSWRDASLREPSDVSLDGRSKPQGPDAIDRLGTNEIALQHKQSPLCPTGKEEIVYRRASLCAR